MTIRHLCLSCHYTSVPLQRHLPHIQFVCHSQCEKNRTRLDRYHSNYGDWGKEYIFDARGKGKKERKRLFFFFKHTTYKSSLNSENKNTKTNNMYVWMNIFTNTTKYHLLKEAWSHRRYTSSLLSFQILSE